MLAAGIYDFLTAAAMAAIIGLFLLAVIRSDREEKREVRGKTCPKCGKRSKGGKPHDYPCYWYDVQQDENEDV